MNKMNSIVWKISVNHIGCEDFLYYIMLLFF